MIAERYQLIKRLGCGGMGAVYEAIHLALGRPCAIKLLTPEYASSDPQARTRLRQEALTECDFDHPNLVRLHDFGTNIVSVKEDGHVRNYDELYIVMELLKGHSLKEQLQPLKPLRFDTAITIAAQLADALGEIHSRGVIYRDLKPENVLICSDHKGHLLVKIVDFGAVKMLRTSTAEGAIDLTKALFVGSPLYASPENCKGERLDERSDIYSLGLILYEMIAGVRAFDHRDFLTLLNSHAYEAPPPIDDIPAPLSNIIMRALAKNPNDRQQTAIEFAENLRALDLDKPVKFVTQTNHQDRNEETVVRTRSAHASELKAREIEADANKGGHSPIREFSKLRIPVVSQDIQPGPAKRRVALAVALLICLAQSGSLLSREKKGGTSAPLALSSVVDITKRPISNAINQDDSQLKDGIAKSIQERISDQRMGVKLDLDSLANEFRFKKLLNSNKPYAFPKPPSRPPIGKSKTFDKSISKSQQTPTKYHDRPVAKLADRRRSSTNTYNYRPPGRDKRGRLPASVGSRRNSTRNNYSRHHR